MNTTIAKDIQQQVTIALGRYGEANPLAVEGNQLVLHTGGTENRIEVAELSARWDSLSDLQRSRQCTGLARQLTAQRRQRNTPQIERTPRLSLPLLTGILLAVAGGVFWFFSGSTGGSTGGSATTTPAEIMATGPATQATVLTGRDERATRVCEATRLRVLRGATVGPTEVEGWVVEVALIRPHEPNSWSEQNQFLRIEEDYEESRIIWEDAPKLKLIQGYATGVQVRKTRYPDTDTKWDQLVITLHGGYVKYYFQERQRTLLVRLAQDLAKSYGANYGALYGRCKGRTSHHLGSWFMGTNPTGAAVSLLYFMGATSNPPYLAPALLTAKKGSALTPDYAFAALEAFGKSVTSPKLAGWIGSQDGTVASLAASTEHPSGLTFIQFPFLDSNRALRASHSVYRALLPLK